MKNHLVGKAPEVIKNNIEKKWEDNTIFNHYETPIQFMNDVVKHKDDPNLNSRARSQIKDGIAKYDRINDKNIKYDTLYEDVANKVKNALVSRGFTSKMLYGTVEFTSQNTGMMNKHRAMLGRKDCYFKESHVSDGKLFHDIYINMSFSYGVADSTIEKNAYALFALTREMARLVPIRIFIVNHVGTDTPTCYSYCLKRFRQPIIPKEFLFFTSDSKRTFGWATYEILNKDNDNSTVGNPPGTVSIANFNLEREIKTIWTKYQKTKKTTHTGN